MNAVADKKIEKTIRELSALDKLVRRKLFEVETLLSMREMKEGKGTRVGSGRALFASLSK